MSCKIWCINTRTRWHSWGPKNVWGKSAMQNGQVFFQLQVSSFALISRHVRGSNSARKCWAVIVTKWGIGRCGGLLLACQLMLIECKNLGGSEFMRDCIALGYLDILAIIRWCYAMVYRNLGDLVCKRVLSGIGGEMIVFFPEGFGIHSGYVWRNLKVLEKDA